MLNSFRLILPALLVGLLVSACDDKPEAATATVEPVAKTSPPATLPAGVTLVESYAGDDSGFSIPYAKYVLDNGLTVILHEDHSDPMVHVDVAYHVGSSREEPGRSGFAHFFEHMMFEGSENVPEGSHGKIISDAGGSLNGTTNSDRTNYYETVPIDQLEIALWLEADRMGFLLQAVDEEKFEVQRETVKNERGQRIDNVPYGRTSETMMKNLYPPSHPYSWPIIGWTEDLDAATLEDLERFFLRWYGPNNAQLVIGGDIDPQQTLEWVAKYFGPIPRGPEVEDLPKQPAELDQDRYVTLEDNIHLPAIAILIPTVAYYDEAEAPLDAAAKILGQGKASLLYQRLVQTGRAVSAYSSHACRELACEMAFIVVQNPSSGETLAEMEAAIRETLVEFSERGVRADDLQKFKAQIESGRIFSMQSVGGKVGALAFGEMFNDDPQAIQSDLQRYQAVTPEQVTEYFTQFITGQPAVILSVVPNGQPQLAANEPNYEVPEAAETIPPEVSPPAPDEGPQLRTVQDDFDRSVQPEPGMNPGVQLPPINDSRLANGVRMLSVPNTETPTVTLQAVFDMGQRDETAGKAGLASLTAAMMNEASKERTAAEFSEALERIGASINVNSSQYETTVTLNTLSKHLDEAMVLMMERILQPAFTEEDFTRLKSQAMESLVQAEKSGPSLAGRAASAVLVSADSPLSYPGSGLLSTVEGITLDDVKAFYHAHIPSHLMGVLVSTSLPADDIDRAVAPLGELAITEVARPDVGGLNEIQGQTIYLIDKQDAAQSSVRILHPALPYDALGDYFRAGLLNFTLGGTFDARINLNLREDKGWTYGAYSSFGGGREYGTFQFSSEINRAATTDAIEETLEIIQNYAENGMTEEEYEYMQNAVGRSEAMLYETPGKKLGLLDKILTYDLPLDYRSRQKTLLRETDLETLNQLASELLKPKDVAIIVVGDSASLQAELKQLGLPIVLLNSEGRETTEPQEAEAAE